MTGAGRPSDDRSSAGRPVTGDQYREVMTSIPGRSTSTTGTAASGGTARTSPPLALAVDWERAARWGGRLASPGPTASRTELEDLVAGLHDAAQRARPLALRASRLTAAVETAGTAEQPVQVLVVDRPGWARAAARSFAAMAGGTEVAEDERGRGAGAGAGHGAGPGDDDGATRATPSAAVTAQVAALLGLLAGRVLGQFDPFAHDVPPGGRLLLIAPNVLRVERSMAAVPNDFRLWVAVHEQTHALQFAAAPWLAEHLRGEVGALVEDLTSISTADELGSMITGAVRTLRGEQDDGLGMLGALLDDERRARVERITAIMSLLEGHADVAMDSVGSRAIPSLRRLRARFDARRRKVTGLDRVLRRVLGMEAKLAQYRDGAVFVRAVRRAGGRDALDAVWSGPDALPTPAEIADPKAWVSRVHG